MCINSFLNKRIVETAIYTYAVHLLSACWFYSRFDFDISCHDVLQIVMRALQAGKHALSEKPSAGTIEEAAENIKLYRAMDSPPVWNIAENFRYEDVFEAQAALIASIGNVVKMDLLADMPMAEGNKYVSHSCSSAASLLGPNWIIAHLFVITPEGDQVAMGQKEDHLICWHGVKCR